MQISPRITKVSCAFLFNTELKVSPTPSSSVTAVLADHKKNLPPVPGPPRFLPKIHQPEEMPTVPTEVSSSEHEYHDRYSRVTTTRPWLPIEMDISAGYDSPCLFTRTSMRHPFALSGESVQLQVDMQHAVKGSKARGGGTPSHT